MVDSAEEDPLTAEKKLQGELEKTLADISNSLSASAENREKDRKGEMKHSLKDVVCYRCGEKAHVKRKCPMQAETQEQGNVSRQLNRHTVVRCRGLILRYVSCS